MTIQIEQVAAGSGLDRFIRFSEAVYRGDPNWVPPQSGELEFLLGDRNPFFHHAEMACFIVVADGKVTGRVAAIIDRNHINYHREQAGFFGFYECLPDPAPAELLLAEASAWLKRRDIEVIRGPMNPSTNETCGLLLEGYGSPPAFMTSYNPPYYHGQLERCGLRKCRDLYAYRSDLGDIVSIGRLERAVASIRKKNPGLRVRHIDPHHIGKELAVIKDIYNSALSRQWGFVPLTGEEIDSMAERLKNVIDPELILIAEQQDGPAGFLMALPDHNQAARRSGQGSGLLGSLQPWASRPKITTVRVRNAGIREEHRRKGIDAVLYLEAFHAAVRKGYESAEMSWVLEDNVLMQSGCELMGGKLSRKYRIYEKAI